MHSAILLFIHYFTYYCYTIQYYLCTTLRLIYALLSEFGRIAPQQEWMHGLLTAGLAALVDLYRRRLTSLRIELCP